MAKRKDNAPITFFVSEDLKAAAEIEAKRLDLSLSQFIRRAIRELLDETKQEQTAE